MVPNVDEGEALTWHAEANHFDIQQQTPVSMPSVRLQLLEKPVLGGLNHGKGDAVLSS